MKFKCSVLFAFLVGQVVSQSCPKKKCISKDLCNPDSPTEICLPCGKECVIKAKRDLCDSKDLCRGENGKCVAELDCKSGKRFECKNTNASGETLCDGNDCANVCKTKKKRPKQCPRSRKGGKQCIPSDKCNEEKFDCIPCKKGNGKKAECVLKKAKELCVTDEACTAAKGKCVTKCVAGKNHKCDTSACGGVNSGCACKMMKEKPSCSKDENCTGKCAPDKACKDTNPNCDKSLCGEDSGCACYTRPNKD